MEEEENISIDLNKPEVDSPANEVSSQPKPKFDVGSLARLKAKHSSLKERLKRRSYISEHDIKNAEITSDERQPREKRSPTTTRVNAPPKYPENHHKRTVSERARLIREKMRNLRSKYEDSIQRRDSLKFLEGSRATNQSIDDGSRNQLQKVFKTFDGDGTGEIDKYEFLSACRALGLTQSGDKILKIFGQIDTDNSGYLDFGEFKNAARKIIDLGKYIEKRKREIAKPIERVVTGPLAKTNKITTIQNDKARPSYRFHATNSKRSDVLSLVQLYDNKINAKSEIKKSSQHISGIDNSNKKKFEISSSPIADFDNFDDVIEKEHKDIIPTSLEKSNPKPFAHSNPKPPLNPYALSFEVEDNSDDFSDEIIDIPMTPLKKLKKNSKKVNFAKESIEYEKEKSNTKRKLPQRSLALQRYASSPIITKHKKRSVPKNLPNKHPLKRSMTSSKLLKKDSSRNLRRANTAQSGVKRKLGPCDIGKAGEDGSWKPAHYDWDPGRKFLSDIPLYKTKEITDDDRQRIHKLGPTQLGRNDYDAAKFEIKDQGDFLKPRIRRCNSIKDEDLRKLHKLGPQEIGRNEYDAAEYEYHLYEQPGILSPRLGNQKIDWNTKPKHKQGPIEVGRNKYDAAQYDWDEGYGLGERMRSKIDWDKKPKHKQGPVEMGQFTDFKAAKYAFDDGYGIDDERFGSRIDWNKKAKHKAGPREIGTTKGYKRAKYEIDDGYGLDEERLGVKIDWEKKAKHKAGPREIGTNMEYDCAKYEIDYGYGIDEERGGTKVDWGIKPKHKAGPREIGTINGYKRAKYKVDEGYGLEEERIRSKIDWDKKAKHKAGPREIGTLKGFKRAKYELHLENIANINEERIGKKIDWSVKPKKNIGPRDIGRSDYDVAEYPISFNDFPGMNQERLRTNIDWGKKNPRNMGPRDIGKMKDFKRPNYEINLDDYGGIENERLRSTIDWNKKNSRALGPRDIGKSDYKVAKYDYDLENSHKARSMSDSDLIKSPRKKGPRDFEKNTYKVAKFQTDSDDGDFLKPRGIIKSPTEIKSPRQLGPRDYGRFKSSEWKPWSDAELKQSESQDLRKTQKTLKRSKTSADISGHSSIGAGRVGFRHLGRTSTYQSRKKVRGLARKQSMPNQKRRRDDLPKHENIKLAKHKSEKYIEVMKKDSSEKNANISVSKESTEKNNDNSRDRQDSNIGGAEFIEDDREQKKTKGEENVIQPIEKQVVNAVIKDIGGGVVDNHGSGDSGDDAGDVVEKMIFSFTTKEETTQDYPEDDSDDLTEEVTEDFIERKLTY